MASSKGFMSTEIREVVADIAALLKERKETITVVETAAGGFIAACILSMPGASAYFKGGLTLYTLESRIAYAGWTEESIKDYAGPTPEIVAGLAKNVRARLGSTYTLCESGTAGPTGGTTRNRMPGYVALAVNGDAGTATREVETGSEDRMANMTAFAMEALKLVRDVIQRDVRLQ